jgi:hypothetical protein
MVAIAAIETRILEVGDLLGVASRAANLAVRPAHRYHELAAVLVVAEELDCLLECFGTFHAVNVAGKQ